MLILTRRSNEKIYIGDSVAVVVLGIENNRVKIGIEAPSDVTILREEIADDATKELIDNNIKSKVADSGVPLKTGT